MVTPELALGFLVLLALAQVGGLDPAFLTGVPPLDVLAAFGGLWAALAEFLAYGMVFVTYQVGALAALTAAGRLLGPDGAGRVRRTLAQGRDATGLRPLMWAVLCGAPTIVVALFLLDQPVAVPRLLFVVAVITLTGAQVLRPFTFEQFWRTLISTGATLRGLSRISPPCADPAPRPVPVPPAPTERGSPTVGGGPEWLEAVPDHPGEAP